MQKPILTHPNEILTTKSEAVTDFESSALRQLIEDLRDTLAATDNGVGLAAPQIAVNLRVIILRDEDGEIHVFVNPEITRTSGKTRLNEGEGCLSLPGQSFDIERYTNISVKYRDESGKRQKIQKVRELWSVAFQHEIDHLDGILCIDRGKKVK